MHALPWLNHYKKHDDGERHTLKPSCMQWDRDPHTELIKGVLGTYVDLTMMLGLTIKFLLKASIDNISRQLQTVVHGEHFLER